MNNKRAFYIIILLVIAAAIFFATKKTPVAAPVSPSGTVLSDLETSTPPWPAEFAHLKDRLAAIGLPALTAEGTVLHIHQHLDISVNGEVIPVPAGIGIDSAKTFIAPIHVHDTSGIVHVESPTVQDFTLGQFFDIWGLQLTNTCIGGLCTDDTHILQLYVNGVKYGGNPRDLVLAAHQELYLFYGTSNQLPQTIPSSFTFPEGY